MSRVHHIRRREGKTVTACGLEPRNMRATGVPVQTTCGGCKTELAKQYREETAPYLAVNLELPYSHESNVAARKAPAIVAALTWWQGG